MGRRKARHFCITTTSQIIGAVAAAPAAPLSTPLQVCGGLYYANIQCGRCVAGCIVLISSVVCERQVVLC